MALRRRGSLLRRHRRENGQVGGVAYYRPVRCAKWLTFLLLSSTSALGEEAPPAVAGRPCVDAVAVALVIDMWSPYFDFFDGSPFLPELPSKVRWQKPRHVFGDTPLPARLTTWYEMPVPVTDKVDHLMRLQRVGDLWWVVELTDQIVRTRDGRYAWPVFESVSPRTLQEHPWIPPDWEQRLVPIDYDAARYDNEFALTTENIAVLAPGNQWVRFEDRRLIARRGLMLDALDLRVTDACRRGLPEHWPPDVGTK